MTETTGLKIMCVANLVFNLLLWFFVITSNEVKKVSLDRVEDIELRLDVIEANQADTIVININNYVDYNNKTINNKKK